MRSLPLAPFCSRPSRSARARPPGSRPRSATTTRRSRRCCSPIRRSPCRSSSCRSRCPCRVSSSRFPATRPRRRGRRSAARVDQANAAARVQPTRAGYLNAIQVYPFSDGALYQVYAAPGEVTDIALEPGEQLVGSGPVAAGDTVRWIIGDTESGAGAAKRVHILVKPTRADLITNLVINTDRRTYHLELRSRREDLHGLGLLGLSAGSAHRAAPAERRGRRSGAGRDRRRHQRAELPLPHRGRQSAWRPLRAFDDGRQVFIEFPSGIGQGEMPPLWVIGAEGDGQLVNYRVQGNHMIVDRLFAAAELRLGGDHQQIVRIVRTDGRPQS